MAGSERKQTLPGANDRAEAESADDTRQDVRLWLAAALLALLLGAVFQGGRGIWDPSEGFYTNAAVSMTQSGDWWTPRLNGEPFLDKPPVVYWSIAAGMELLGVNEWGARFALIFWYAGTALLIGALAHSFWGGRSGPLATAVYALSLLPFLGSSTITTDPILAFWTTAALYLFWRMERSATAHGRSLWAVGLGAAIGLGLMTKGPAMLIFLPPLALFLLIRRRLWRALGVPGLWLGVALALALGVSWYLSMMASLDGARDYILDNQVSGRLVGGHYGRNPGWSGVLKVYLPTLIAGALPWALFWPGWLHASAGQWLRLSWWRHLSQRPAALLTILWFTVPLSVLASASSKLPLYALPLAAPLALVATKRIGERLQRNPVRRSEVVALTLWIALLMSIKLVSASWPTHHDTRATARALEQHRVPHSTQIVGINKVRNSLLMYGYGRIRQAATGAHEIYFSPIRSLEDVIDSLDPGETVVFIGNEEDFAHALPLLGSRSESCRRLTGGHRRESFLRCPGIDEGHLVPQG